MTVPEKRPLGSPLPKFAASLRSRGKYGYPSYRRLKRVLDIVVSCLALIVLSPVMLVIALLIAAKDGFPVIYQQERVGEDGCPFQMFKFRSMVKNSKEILEELFERDPALKEEYLKNFKLDPDPRITAVGRFIRKTSLDELPQFWNVLRGDMSIVGPRPIVLSELANYGGAWAAYLAMKPGCAGLWQCSGRSETSYEERIALDEQYYRTASIRNDVKILLMTFISILRRDGAK